MTNTTFIRHIYNLTRKDKLTREMLIDILQTEYKKPFNTAKSYIGALFSTGILQRHLGCVTVNEELIRGLNKNG